MVNILTAEGQSLLSGIDVGGYHNTVTVQYTVGHDGSGADYTFSNAANKAEEGLQLGGTTIIPALARVIDVVVISTEGWTGSAGAEAGLGTEVGNASGGAEYMVSADIDGLNDVGSLDIDKSAMPVVSASATSVYVSCTPTTNDWDEFTAGISTIYVTYIDNSAI